METGVWWRYGSTAEERSKSVLRAKALRDRNSSVEIAGSGNDKRMYVMVVRESDHSNVVGAPVVRLGDNASVVTQVKKFAGTRDSRAASTIRYCGEKRNASRLVL